jgi:endonuclease G
VNGFSRCANHAHPQDFLMFSTLKNKIISNIGNSKFSQVANSAKAFTALILCISAISMAFPGESMASDACDTMYPSAVQPQVLNEALTKKSDVLCFEEFSIFHSGLTRTPLWTAQHLTVDSVTVADGVDREDVFHSEQMLASANRSELEDFRRSGYDRGHMAPAADMASVKAQDESFSLANMVPQLPELNRGLWSKVESTTRELARQYSEVYVVTGPAFIGKDLKRLNGRVIVPSHVYKAVYVPGAQQAGVWWTSNSGNGREYEVISLSELSKRTGIDVFPTLPQQVKDIAAKLPAPKVYSRKSDVAKPRQADHHSTGPAAPKPPAEIGWLDLGLAVLERLLK